jgi:hypothetical protein
MHQMQKSPRRKPRFFHLVCSPPFFTSQYAPVVQTIAHRYSAGVFFFALEGVPIGGALF